MKQYVRGTNALNQNQPAIWLNLKENKMRFDTFDQVVSKYEHTKPIISSVQSREDDIRPIGVRARKHERIRKVDDNTYLLLDGLYGGSMFSHTRTENSMQYEQDMAPIMWTREADGDYIHIRNCTTRAMAVSRYKFFECYLPHDILFRRNQSGKHWVRVYTTWTGGVRVYEDFALPKTAYFWDWNKSVACTDDGKRLKFKVHKDGMFTRVGEMFKVVSKSIDKELKKQWKEHITAFYTQAAALAPMLDLSWSGIREYKTLIAERVERDGNLAYFYNVRKIPHAVAQEIVRDAEHELRIPLVALIVKEIGGKREVRSQEDLVRVKSSYNRLMNKVLGMYKLQEV